MKVVIEKKEFKTEFGYYEDVLGGKDKKIVDIRFWNGHTEVFPDEIEIIIDEEDTSDVEIQNYMCGIME